MTWTVPDLNTRETATLVWAVVALVTAIATPSLRAIVIGGARVVAKPFAAVVLVATTLLAVAIAIGLAQFGFWRMSMIPTTVAWFVGTAVVGTFSMGGVGELRRLVLRTIALTALVEFVSNAYTFPLPVELLLVPSVVILVTLVSYANLRPEFANLRTPLKVFCLALFVGTLTPTVIEVLQRIGHLVNVERAREFLLPLILTAAFLPYLYLVRMVVAWQTTLSMLRYQMQDHPAVLKAARRALVRSCHVSLSRIQLFEPEFRWRLSAATSEEEVRLTMAEFKCAAAERPWRKRRGANGVPEVQDLLPGASGSGIFVRSVALADSVRTAVAAAAMATGRTREEVSELLDRLNGLKELSAVSPVSRAQAIQVLAQRRSLDEIEVIAPELGKLSILHASDIVRLAGDFDSLLHLAGLPATESPRMADELHTMSTRTGLPLAETVEVFVTLLGGAVERDQDTD